MICWGTMGSEDVSVAQGCSKSQFEVLSGLDSGGYFEKSLNTASVPLADASFSDGCALFCAKLCAGPAIAKLKTIAARTGPNPFFFKLVIQITPPFLSSEVLYQISWRLCLRTKSEGSKAIF